VSPLRRQDWNNSEHDSCPWLMRDVFVWATTCRSTEYGMEM
jgi:hypothetical protein